MISQRKSMSKHRSRQTFTQAQLALSNLTSYVKLISNLNNGVAMDSIQILPCTIAEKIGTDSSLSVEFSGPSP